MRWCLIPLLLAACSDDTGGTKIARWHVVGQYRGSITKTSTPAPCVAAIDTQLPELGCAADVTRDGDFLIDSHCSGLHTWFAASADGVPGVYAVQAEDESWMCTYDASAAIDP